jgi:hypothetical protein
MYKLRSMVDNAEQDRVELEALKRDGWAGLQILPRPPNHRVGNFSASSASTNSLNSLMSCGAI